MTAYTQVENDVLISRKPCLLYSITITNFGSGEGQVDLYDGRTAYEPDKAITVMGGPKQTKQYSWKGLYFSKGLFVDNVDKVDDLTIEWSPLIQETMTT